MSITIPFEKAIIRNRATEAQTSRSPRAPWAIHRADLINEPVRSIIERLLRTGKLIFQGDCAEGQSTLFNENEGDDNAQAS